MKTKTSSHESARGHVTGKSQFIDDISPLRNEVFIGVVMSPSASGQIKSIDLDEALNLSGVVAAFTAKDFYFNKWGPVVKDQPLLAEGRVHFCGEPIALVACTDPLLVPRALELVNVDIEEESAVLDLKTAIDQKRFLGDEQFVFCGDFQGTYSRVSHQLEGTVMNGGQEHFYLESQCAIAYPTEEGGINLISSTQHTTEVQHVVAKALGLKQNEVVVRVKRMGGAFGGKESQSAHIASLAALVAHKIKRPARIALTKDEDMLITGKRHPFLTHYKVGFNDEGFIECLQAHLFSDGGAYVDLSHAILQRALLHVDGAYYIPNTDFKGRVCQTHLAPNTAFRGFGGPQGAFVIESIIEDISKTLGIDSLEIRQKNLYGVHERNKTPYGQIVENNQLPTLFEKLPKNAQYEKLRKEVDENNSTGSEWLYGLSTAPVKFGISFTSKFLNQGNALVNIHTDGTLQVSTGATEMGQGVYAKIQKIVSECFGLPLCDVRIMETSTEKNHNTSATAASSGSDINGSAALIASEKIKYRMANIAKQFLEGAQASDTVELFVDEKLNISDVIFENGKVMISGGKSIDFSSLCDLCYKNRVSLGDYGHYKTKGIFFDKKSGQGEPFLYYTQGAASTMIKLNRYTGETKVLASDILMDLGRSINEGIDYGQIAGGFVQCMGWVTNENLYYDKGRLKTTSPTTYKIPNIQDVPRHFHIDLIENNENIKNVRASKAVGEPPFILGLSVWSAIKNALSYLPGDTVVNLSLPATAEVIHHVLSERDTLL